MAKSTSAASTQDAKKSNRLGILLAMAMFVLVVDTSLMNVSISAVVEDLDTTVSGVQSAIALEALVSAAFILLSSKIGDLFGRKRAYVLGLLGYAIGATTMALTQTLQPVIIFWAIIGGLGASLLLPAMQSLIHGNFEGAAQKRVYGLVGAATGIAAAIGPLLGGFITTYLSWRVGFLLEVVIILIVLANIKLVKDVPYTGPREIDLVGALLSIVGMGGIVLSILVWQEGGEYVGILLVVGVIAMLLFARWLVSRKKQGKPSLLDPNLFISKYFRLGISSQMLQNITLGGMMIALPIYFQMVFEYTAMQTGLALAPFSLSIFFISLLAGRRAGKRRQSTIIRAGFGVLLLGLIILIPLIPRADFWLDLRHPPGDCRIRLRPAGFPAEQLYVITHRRRARQRSRRGQLCVRLVRAFLWAGLCRRHDAGSPDHLHYEHDPGKHGAGARSTAAGSRGAGRRRPDYERYTARGAACWPASGSSR